MRINFCFVFFQAITDFLPDPFDRSLFLTNLMTSNGQDKDKQHTKGKTEQQHEDPPPPLWRLNMEAILKNPKMTASFPEFPDAQFQGRALFIAGKKLKTL